MARCYLRFCADTAQNWRSWSTPDDVRITLEVAPEERRRVCRRALTETYVAHCFSGVASASAAAGDDDRNANQARSKCLAEADGISWQMCVESAAISSAQIRWHEGSMAQMERWSNACEQRGGDVVPLSDREFEACTRCVTPSINDNGTNRPRFCAHQRSRGIVLCGSVSGERLGTGWTCLPECET